MSLRSGRLYFIGFVLPLLPPTRLFSLKRMLLRWCGAKVGKNVRIASSARFLTSGPLEIGENTWIGHQVLVVGGNSPIEIGSDVDIAPRCLIVSGSHSPQPGAYKAAGPGVSLPIRIGDGVWIGASATVLGGADIGSSSIIAAGSLVRGIFKPNGTYGGVPARALLSATEDDVR